MSALPEADEETIPAFFHHGGDALPSFGAAGAQGRPVTGASFGVRAAVQTFSPLSYVRWELAAGARAELPPEYRERAAYVASGEVEADSQVLRAGDMAVFAPDQTATVRVPSTVMALAGEPLGPQYIEWNFVSSFGERIAQAKADWRARRMKLPYLDHEEHIPLPEDSAPSAEPMS